MSVDRGVAHVAEGVAGRPVGRCSKWQDFVGTWRRNKLILTQSNPLDKKARVCRILV